MIGENKKLDDFESKIDNMFDIIEKERGDKSLFFISKKGNYSKEEMLNEVKQIVNKCNSKHDGILLKKKNIYITSFFTGEDGYYIHTFMGRPKITGYKSGGREPGSLPPKLPRSAFE